jgi:transposase
LCVAETPDMAVFVIVLTADERRVVNAERDSHPEAPVRRKILVLWLLYCGLTRAKAAEVAGLSRPTVQRYVAAYRDGGLDGLRRWGVRGPVSDLVAHTAAIREALTHRPVGTAAEAAEQIERLTGLKREPTQVRQFLKSELGFRWRRTRVVPCPPKKDLVRYWRSHFAGEDDEACVAWLLADVNGVLYNVTQSLGAIESNLPPPAEALAGRLAVGLVEEDDEADAPNPNVMALATA